MSAMETRRCKYLTDADFEEETFGEFKWKIEGFSKLQSKAAAGTAPEERKLLSPIYTTPNNDKWRMVLFPAGNASSAGQMSLYLECCSDDKADDPKWHRCVQFGLRIANPSDENAEAYLVATHRYVPQDMDWGFSSFYKLDELRVVISPNEKPILDLESDSLNLYAYIRVFKDVTGVLWHNFTGWDSKKETGYVGLKNQGATCYMNSLLQSLYFTSYFRKAVFQIPTETDDPVKSVPYALQRLFYQLQNSGQAVDTRELTQSFGWNTIDAFMQHDVQEFNRVLQDNLETKMKGTKAEGSIERLFVGKMKSYIKCVNVEYESSREETFYDIQLNVKGKRDLTDSFKDYVQVEMLDGENKYQSEKYGLQDAKKGVIFTEFPPVLHLQLKRFEYDFQRDQMVKINDRHEYPETIELSEFLEDYRTAKYPSKYHLHGVLVHMGDVHGGHYCAFIKPTSSSMWYKFDDDRVVPVTEKEVYEDNFGGDFSMVSGLMDRQTRFHKSFTNAYMLVYVREADRDVILGEVTEKDIPSHLSLNIERERLEAERIAKERAERHLFINVSVLQESDIKDYQGFDLWNWDAKDLHPEMNFKIRKDETVADLKKMISDACDRPVEQCRIWHFARRQNGSFRQEIPISEKSDADTMVATFNHHAKGLYELRLWLEVSDSKIQDSDGRIAFFHNISSNDRITLFVKYFDPTVAELKFVKSITAKLSLKVGELAQSLVAITGLPPSTAIRIYEEVKPGMICLLKPKDTLRQSELSSGDIICVQKEISKDEEKQYEYPSAPAYYEYLQNRVFIRLLPHPKLAELKNIEFQRKEVVVPISRRNTYDQMAAKIGSLLHVDPFKLQFYVNPTGNDIPKQLIKRVPTQTLHEILHANYYSTAISAAPCFWYEVLEVSVLVLETKRVLKLTLLNDCMKETDSIDLLVPKVCTVQDLLNLLEKKVPGAVQMSILEVMAHRSIKSLKPTDQITDNGSQLYAQPTDGSVSSSPTTPLVTVYHFSKEPSHAHSVPFKLHVQPTDSIQNIKILIKNRLGLPDKDMEKIKLAIVTANNHASYPEDDSCTIGEYWEAGAYIGLDHPDRSATKKQGFWQEKAIKIHN